MIEDGQIESNEEGIPQGASASPALAFICIMSTWVQWWQEASARRGNSRVSRMIPLLGSNESDAEQFLNELKERFLKCGLELHPEKTRLIQFGRYAILNRSVERANQKAFLLTHTAAATTKDGKFTVVRRTIKKRLRARMSRRSNRNSDAECMLPSN